MEFTRNDYDKLLASMQKNVAGTSKRYYSAVFNAPVGATAQKTGTITINPNKNFVITKIFLYATLGVAAGTSILNLVQFILNQSASLVSDLPSPGLGYSPGGVLGTQININFPISQSSFDCRILIFGGTQGFITVNALPNAGILFGAADQVTHYLTIEFEENSKDFNINV